MKKFLKVCSFTGVLVMALTLLSTGCSQPVNTAGTAGETKTTGKDKAIAKNDGHPSTAPTNLGKVNDDHSGYWCDEHGLPEAVCDLCSKKYREAEKAKGNWCEHNRVKSSCFKCNPGLKEMLAAEYKAKTGKVAPPTEDEEKK